MRTLRVRRVIGARGQGNSGLLLWSAWTIMIKLLLVDDQPAVLDALRQYFALEPDLQIVGRASDGLGALALAQELHPDIVLTDIKMPNMDGLTAIQALHHIEPAIKIVVLSIYDDLATRTQAFAAGAVEFVSKHDAMETLITAIRQVAGGLG
jgi:DNA-binding NarL/FixJ family response regulator